MSKYSCKCAAPGCAKVFEVEADSWESAFKKMFAVGQQHVVDFHPDLPETDDREARGREFAVKNMKKI
jgi:hypothetical protein